MKLKKFVLNELEAELYMGIGTFKDIQALSEMVLKTELSKEEYGNCRGVCIDGGKRDVICCVLTENTNKKDYSRVLLHEVFHGIHYIFDYLGIDMSYSNTEALAYYIDYYYNELLKFLQEVEDGDKRSTKAKKRKSGNNGKGKPGAIKK